MKIIPNIQYKSVLENFKSVEDRNYAFNNLDKQSQRMEVAWEVLQLLTGNYIQAAGKYDETSTFWDNKLERVASSSDDSKDFQKNLLAIKKEKCVVCARGACMLAQIRLGNDIDPYSRDYDMGSKSSVKGFSMKDFIKMENSFENYSDNNAYHDNTDEQLANIMCNVLVNGNFKKQDKTNYLTFKK